MLKYFEPSAAGYKYEWVKVPDMQLPFRGAAIGPVRGEIYACMYVCMYVCVYECVKVPEMKIYV